MLRFAAGRLDMFTITIGHDSGFIFAYQYTSYDATFGASATRSFYPSDGQLVHWGRHVKVHSSTVAMAFCEVTVAATGIMYM